ncbi:GTP-binding protein Rheb [Fukomys damarensis]|uniref:GTP-binding protein Rheb n=1 Tax=Fukomys damarensis TaxID=885580 RepID=A0A091DMA1_FUKDA|nr:GTP-binding protein Rheb [Fukomys damarensis]
MGLGVRPGGGSGRKSKSFCTPCPCSVCISPGLATAVDEVGSRAEEVVKVLQPKSGKIAILGYRSVGKSSRRNQFAEGQFVDSYDTAMENTFTELIMVNGQEYHRQPADTAGRDEHSSSDTLHRY